MPDASDAITLSAALIAGVAGSAHCVFMCGGIAGALSLRSGGPPTARCSTLRSAGLYHAGRLVGYTISGAVFGALGAGFLSAIDLPQLSFAMRAAAGLLLVLIAVKSFGRWNPLAWVEKLGAHFWRSLQPLVRLLRSRQSTSRALLLGLLWGWLPCGLVYSMLLFAALGASALRGGAIMLSFGLGTFPVMLASSLYASRATRHFQQAGARRWSAALLLLFGLWLAWAALPSAHHPDHSEHLSAVRAGVRSP